MRQSAFLAVALAGGCFIGTNHLSAAVCNLDGTANDSVCTVDTVIDFTAEGTFDDGATLSGVLDIDVTAGSIAGEDLSIVGGNLGSTAQTFTGSPSNEGAVAPSGWDVDFLNAGGYELALTIDLSAQPNQNSLVGYSGGNLCFEIPGGTAIAQPETVHITSAATRRPAVSRPRPRIRNVVSAGAELASADGRTRTLVRTSATAPPRVGDLRRPPARHEVQ